jgi:hypothetical protein
LLPLTLEATSGNEQANPILCETFFGKSHGKSKLFSKSAEKRGLKFFFLFYKALYFTEKKV